MEHERKFCSKISKNLKKLFRTTVVAKSIKATNPNVKLFMFLTDPIDRLRSHIKMCVRSKSRDCPKTEERVNFENFKVVITFKKNSGKRQKHLSS